MIVVYHTEGRKLKDVLDATGSRMNLEANTPLEAMFILAERFPDEYISWQAAVLLGKIDQEIWEEVLHHDCMMVSDLSHHNPIPTNVHYVEDSPFLKVQKEVTYPTWQMSSCIGAVHAQVLLQIAGQINPNTELDLALNLMAKHCQSQGLFCYHTPLLAQNGIYDTPKENQNTFVDPYLFVAKTRKKKWLFFLFLCHLLFEQRLMLGSLTKGLFTSFQPINFDSTTIPVYSTKSSTSSDRVDVIIPTMGRAQYLYDVLKDFSSQTILPEKVIIVEQNDQPNSTTELTYLTSESWPFKIIHHFIHQTGACNARNVALAETTADWVFFADDDIRFDTRVIEKALSGLTRYGASCIAMSCLRRGEKKIFHNSMQWMSFPSGASIVQGTLSRKLTFKTAYEHGYGEDKDYGMQLRNCGADILYFPEIDLLHLKAPVGGFRKEIIQPWESEDILPKPSPTIMYFKIKHTTTKQLKGYKFLLFIAQFSQKKPLNFIGFIKQSKRAWNNAVKWAQILHNS